MKYLSNLIFPGLFLIVLAGSVLSVNSGCKPYRSEEYLLKLDTLEKLVADLNINLELNTDYIAERRDSMQNKLNVILRNMPDTGEAEVKSNITRYAGILQFYSHFTDTYPALEYDASEEMKRFEIFKKAYKDGNLKGEEFDLAYIKLKTDLEETLKQAKDLNYNIYAVSNDYKRTGKIINELYKPLSDAEKGR